MNLALMRLIDHQFLETPFYGVRQMRWHLQNEAHAVNQKRIRRLTRLMRLMPIYQKPDTSRPAKGHKTYPYLLGGLRVERPNQVWCADITYLPMRSDGVDASLPDGIAMCQAWGVVAQGNGRRHP
jgi:putative transposase